MLDTAFNVLKMIEDNSYEAYIVGGFVRDYIMGIKSNDVDITTNAKPKDLIKIFPNANIDNEVYGSVIVYLNNIRFEITTYRDEGNYLDNRHPDTVNYVDDLKIDLKRRDFTINTICMDKEGNIVDLLNSRSDIDNKIIKTVIEPLESFKIDSLRILRAIRFATTLDFELALDVKEAIMQSKYLLKDLSINRKKSELDKIFSSPNIEKGIKLIKELDLIDVLYLDNINKVKPCSQVIGIWTMLDVDNIYPFTRNELKLMKDIRESIKNNPLAFTTLYYYDLYPCTVAGEILSIPKKEIMDNYKSMPIHKRSDIVIDSYDLIDYLKIEDGPIISKLWKELEIKLLNLEVNNNKEELLNLAKKIYTSSNLVKEDADETKTTVVPLLFFKEYKKLNISLEEFIFLMYLKDKGNTFTFDPKKMSEELGLSIKDILVLISSLTDKKLLLIDTFKNDKGIGEEKVDISLFYEKIASIISDEVIKDNEEELDNSIFSTIEKEFGRTLNSSEIEFIKAWASSFDSGVIIEAVKEAVLNGVSSIRYIDKILYEWSKLGIKTSEDVRHFLNNKNKEIKEKEPVEVFDYDWFDDEDE